MSTNKTVRKRITNDLNKSIEDLLDNKKLRHFVRWYVDGANANEWDRVKQYLNNVTMNFALDNYLERNDVKSAIEFAVKEQKDINLIKVYQAMLKKALEGDVNSANWIVKFSDSSFFNNKRSAIDDLLQGLDVDEDE